MVALSRSLTRSAGFLAIALTLSISACGGDDAPPSVIESSGGSTAPVDYPIDDVCAILSTEDVGSVLGREVEATPSPGSCTFASAGGDNSPSVISVIDDPGGGLESARPESEAALGAAAQPLDVGGIEGYVVIGAQGETSVAQGAVAAEELIISVSTVGGAVEDIGAVVQALLEIALDSL